MAHRPAPYSIAVAALIALHCQHDSPLYHNERIDDDDDHGTGTSKSNFSLVDSFLRDILLQSSSSSSFTDGTDRDNLQWASLHGRPVQSLLRQLEVAVDRDDEDDSTGKRSCNIALQFKGWLMVATSSVDALTDLMTTIQRAVTDEIVDPTSAHGVFLRSCLLGYDELSFESVIELWKDFREEVRDESANRSNNSSTNSGSNGDSYQQQWMLSSQQVESAILDQCWKMATSVPEADVDVDTMQNSLRSILQLNPELPSAHLLRFMLCLKSGERVGAVDALHQYMDYALSSSSSHSDDPTASVGVGGAGEDILQFAAIVLAMLHDQFGEGRLVASATEEAVRVAQQSQDAGAVAFALGWLAIVYANDDSKRHALMQRCIQRSGVLQSGGSTASAASTTLRPLWAGASLSLAAQPQSNWTALAQAVTDPAATVAAANATTMSAVTAVAAGDVAGGGVGDRPTHASYLDERYTGTTAAVAAARQKLVAAGLYSHFGETSLAAHTTMSALYCQKDHLSSSDVAVAIHNLCSTATSGSAMLMDSSGLAGKLPLSSLPSSSADVSVYGSALQSFVSLREEYGLPVDGVFHFEVALVLHEWAVRRRDWDHADALMTAMESHLYPRLENRNEIIFDMDAQKALVLSRQKRCDEAKSQLVEAIAKYKLAKRHGPTARLLLQLCTVHLDSCPSQFMNALSPLLECLGLCKKHKMDGVEDAALLNLAQVHFCMGHHVRARQIVQDVLPRLLQHGHVGLQAEAYLTLAKCHMKQAKECVDHTPKQSKILQRAVQELEKSAALFSKCHDRHKLQEVYYLTARIYHVLPDSTSQRDLAAKAFIQASGRPLSSLSTADVLSAMSSRTGLLTLSTRPSPVVLDSA